MVATNTLLSPTMILAKAMVMVRNAEPGPCEITADFAFPTDDMTLKIDDFAEAHLRPALDVALKSKRLRAECGSFEKKAHLVIDEECYSGWGIHGRYRRFYDIATDTMSASIEMRVGEDDDDASA